MKACCNACCVILEQSPKEVVLRVFSRVLLFFLSSACKIVGRRCYIISSLVRFYGITLPVSRIVTDSKIKQ